MNNNQNGLSLISRVVITFILMIIIIVSVIVVELYKDDRTHISVYLNDNPQYQSGSVDNLQKAVTEIGKEYDAAVEFYECDNDTIWENLTRIKDKDDDYGIIIVSGIWMDESICNVIGNCNNKAFYVEDFGGIVHSKNYKTFDFRLYQAKYLAGIIAATESKTGKILYIADKINDKEVINANAFILGMQSVNSELELYVANVEDDGEAKDVLDKYIEEKNIDVLAYGIKSDIFAEYADSKGIMFIGSDKKDNISDNCLTITWCDYKPIFEDTVKIYTNGMTDIGNYKMYGINENAVGLGMLSSKVSNTSKRRIINAKVDLKKKDVFNGELYTNEGELVCGKDEKIPDETFMYGLKWYLKGVIVDE
ncbi:MAG: BMP family ABC transporter substrate-binding protein [Butyrivibrio sp.]|nr:BMP family ABC transporter substrate-binding protein [Butyrivibrio sp.]